MVDLPAPFLPSSATGLSGGSSRSRPSTAVTFPNRRTTALNRTATGGPAASAPDVPPPEARAADATSFT